MHLIRQFDSAHVECDQALLVGVTDFVSEIKPVENYPVYEKLAHEI